MSAAPGAYPGGVVRPDGQVAKVKLDFAVLEDIGRACLDEKYAMARTAHSGWIRKPAEWFVFLFRGSPLFIGLKLED